MPAADSGGIIWRTGGDRPVADPGEDKYGYVEYADTFALLVSDRTTITPLTVAISGPWGSGKTSLAQLLDNRLRKVEQYWRLSWDKPPITCWFNAWRHSDAPSVGAALAASVTRDVGKRRPWPVRLLCPLPSVMVAPEWRALRRAGIGIVIAGLAVLACIGLLALFPEIRPKSGALGQLSGHWSVAAVYATAPAAIAIFVHAYRVSNSVGSFVDDPRSAAATGSLAEVRTQIGRVIQQARRGWTIGLRRLVVIFIDDLERCPAQKALDMCEVVSQLLDHDGVVTVLVTDLDLLEAAARDRYRPALADRSPAQPDVGVDYLNKLIQLRFNLPPLNVGEVQRALGFAPGEPAHAGAEA